MGKCCGWCFQISEPNAFVLPMENILNEAAPKAFCSKECLSNFKEYACCDSCGKDTFSAESPVRVNINSVRKGFCSQDCLHLYEKAKNVTATSDVIAGKSATSSLELLVEKQKPHTFKEVEQQYLNDEPTLPSSPIPQPVSLLASIPKIANNSAVVSSTSTKSANHSSKKNSPHLSSSKISDDYSTKSKLTHSTARVSTLPSPAAPIASSTPLSRQPKKQFSEVSSTWNNQPERKDSSAAHPRCFKQVEKIFNLSIKSHA